MKYETRPTARFLKDVKLAKKRGYNMELLAEVLRMLAQDKPLPAKKRDHGLSGVFKGCRECHISPDWLLIYEKSEKDLILYLTRT